MSDLIGSSQDKVPSELGQEEQQEVVLSAKEAWKMLPPSNRRIIKICAILGFVTIFVLPAVTVCLAVWKYKQERAAQVVVVEQR